MVEITLSLVIDLVSQQFPQWARLPIKPVVESGWDNRTFHLGEEMLIRLPSAQSYALQVVKEHKWLPLLAPHLPFAIPQPLAMGHPSTQYPWNWSIYRWIKGRSANLLSLDTRQQQKVALQLAHFLNALHRIDTTSAPLAGTHNYFRGAHPSVYANETIAAIKKLSDVIDADKAIAVWQQAISSQWEKKPLWVHGDFSSGNILIKDGQLAAVIDFGCMAIGDPACDLVVAWTFLQGKSREIFQSNLSLDQNTWMRARGWALWKALITLASLENKQSEKAIQQHRIIDEIMIWNQ